MAACVEAMHQEPEEMEQPARKEESEQMTLERSEVHDQAAPPDQAEEVEEGEAADSDPVKTGEPERMELEKEEREKVHADVAPMEEQLRTDTAPESEHSQQRAETAQRQEEQDPADEREEAVAAPMPGADVSRAECATRVFLASAAQEECASQVATQVFLSVECPSMEAATQAFTVDHSSQHESSTQGRVDLATQAFAAPESASQAPMDATTQACVQTTSVEFSTQVMPEAAIRVFAPTQGAAEASAAMDTEEGAKLKPRAEVKRPKSAFQLYSDDVRSQVIEEIGSKKANLVTTATAAKWKKLDAGSKEGYTRMAQDLKHTFEKDVADGATVAISTKQARLTRFGKGKGAAAKAKARRLRTVEQLKRRAGPKKPKGSYSIWLGENRRKVRSKLVADGVADPSFEEIARAAGKTWLALTKEQKAPYVERAKVLSVKYKDINKACKEYKKANTKDLRAKAKAEAKKKAKQAAQKKKEASKKTQQQGSVGGGAKAALDTPQKRLGSEGAGKPTPSKAKKGVPEKTVYLDMGLLAEAEKAGLAGTFRRLAEREDMKSYSQRVLLDALVANEGLLHRAKDWVLAKKA